MNTDFNQKEYDDVFQKLKNEKMDWDFDEFLDQVNPETKIIPIKKNRTPKILAWVAAASFLVFGGTYFITHSSSVEQNQRITQQISKQKDSIISSDVPLSQQQENGEEEKAKSDSAKTNIKASEANVVEEILPKKQRLRKTKKDILAKNTSDVNASEDAYKADYVIINGQKISNEKDAIDVTKYSVQLFSKKMNETMATTSNITTTDDY